MTPESLRKEADELKTGDYGHELVAQYWRGYAAALEIVAARLELEEEEAQLAAPAHSGPKPNTRGNP